MKLPWIVGGFAVICLASLLFARQGVIITTDGKRHEGDISDKGTAYEVVSADPSRPTAVNRLTIPKPAVKDIIYADNVGQAIKIEQGKLAPNDVNGRVELAKWAMQNRAYDAARDVLEEAKKIDPNNKDVNSLLTTVYAQLHVKPGTPATAPAPATAAPATQAASSEPPKRMVTPEEINRIRQLEWNRKDPINIRIDAEVRQKFLAGSGISPAEFQRMPREQQAIQILDNGKQDLATGVHILADPASVRDFKTILRVVFIPGCATANCHGGTAPGKGGNFYLFPGDTAPALYTNFLTLQTFTKEVNKAQRYLIDRQHPDGSLLLQYMLPLDVAETPHPPAGMYKGAVKIKNDPKFQQVNNWLQSLNPVIPNYDIDLTKDAPKKEAPPK